MWFSEIQSFAAWGLDASLKIVIEFLVFYLKPAWCDVAWDIKRCDYLKNSNSIFDI